MTADPGSTLSHYRLIEKIGEGGMGVVWKAKDLILGRIVAIKVLPADAGRNEDRRRMFLDEARLASSLSDAHIVQVHELGREGGLDFIVMEYVEGRPLSRILHGRPLPPAKVVGLGLQIAQALSRAHHKGLLHRDIKPANIMVTPEGDAKLVDFGLATLIGPRDWSRGPEPPTMTENGIFGGGEAESRSGAVLVGTPLYMSPEQARGEKLDARSDVFSLSAVLYEMTTGHRPFSGASGAEILRQVRECRPVPPHDLVPRLPLELGRVLKKGLAASRADRYQTADDLAVDLRSLGRELESGSSPSYEDLQEPGGSRARRRAGPWIVSGTALAMILAAAGWVGWARRGAAWTSRTIRILPMEVRGQTEGGEDVGLAFAEAIAVNLAQSRDLRVLPVESRPALGGRGDSATDATTARGMGAGRLLTGSLTRRSEAVHVTLNLIDTTQNRIVWGEQREVAEGDLPGLASSFARDTVTHLGGTLPEMYEYIEDLTGGPEIRASPEMSEVIGALRRDDLTAVLASSGRLIGRFPRDLHARALRAYALLLTYERDPAPANRQALEDGLAGLDRVDPDNPYGEIFRAYLMEAAEGRPREAIEVLTRVAGRNDLSPAARAWVLRARAAARQHIGDNDKAIEDVQEALRLDPANAASYAKLASALRAAARPADALVRARQALALRPTYWRYHLDLGEILGSLGRWEDSIGDYAAACRMSRSQEACAIYTAALWRAGRKDEAAAQAKLTASLLPSAWGSYNLACYHALAGDRAEAIETLRRSIQLGFSDALMLADPDLASLRGAPGFETLVSDLKKRVRPE